MNTNRAAGGLAACFLTGMHGRGTGLSSSPSRATLYHEPRRRALGMPGGAQGEASAGADVWLQAERTLLRSAHQNATGPCGQGGEPSRQGRGAADAASRPASFDP